MGSSQIRMRYISEASEGKEAESYPEFAFSDAAFDQAKVTSREGERVNVVLAYSRPAIHFFLFNVSARSDRAFLFH